MSGAHRVAATRTTTGDVLMADWIFLKLPAYSRDYPPARP